MLLSGIVHEASHVRTLLRRTLVRFLHQSCNAAVAEEKQFIITNRAFHQIVFRKFLSTDRAPLRSELLVGRGSPHDEAVTVKNDPDKKTDKENGDDFKHCHNDILMEIIFRNSVKRGEHPAEFLSPRLLKGLSSEGGAKKSWSIYRFLSRIPTDPFSSLFPRSPKRRNPA